MTWPCQKTGSAPPRQYDRRSLHLTSWSSKVGLDHGKRREKDLMNGQSVLAMDDALDETLRAKGDASSIVQLAREGVAIEEVRP